MKEGIVSDIDFDLDDDVSSNGGLTSRPAFPALVALWFAALFGAGCLFLPQVLYDTIFDGNSPFGPQTRVVVALIAAGIGLILGLFIASRVRDEGAEKAAPPTRKRGYRETRAPLDVRAALGLSDDDDDDYDDDDLESQFEDDVDLADIPDQDAFDLTDELGAPIDDPYFASAWSDADTYEIGEIDEVPRSPAPAPVEPAPRYNPFAEFVTPDDDVAPQEPSAVEPPAPAAKPAPQPETHFASNAPVAPPPPPVWPQPRPEEPELQELGVAELVERLARALQGQRETERPRPYVQETAPPRTGAHRHESALATGARPAPDLDRDLRSALDRLSRLNDVA